jgi:alcohol dehydrogenase class IV
MIAIPTAAGTGAEVTPWGVITHSESKRKFGIGGATVIPTVALVDPELTYGLPPGLTAATGADALSHLVEAYVSTNEAPMLDPLILHGIELIGRSLAAACSNGHDATARAEVMLGAMLGGVAISTRWLGACHALAHPLSGISGVPHGMANAIMLPHVVDFNRHAAAERYARVAVALDPTLAAAGPLQPPWPQAEYAAAAISRVIHSPEVLPTRLSDAGVSREQIPLLAAAALLDLNHTTNPRPCSEADLEALYEAAW